MHYFWKTWHSFIGILKSPSNIAYVIVLLRNRDVRWCWSSQPFHHVMVQVSKFHGVKGLWLASCILFYHDRYNHLDLSKKKIENNIQILTLWSCGFLFKCMKAYKALLYYKFFIFDIHWFVTSYFIQIHLLWLSSMSVSTFTVSYL